MKSEQEYKNVLREIRQHCVRKMNGVASTSMRQKGLDYKVNFGLSVPQIKELAARYAPDRGLAETLWNETTRELKILATLLYPAGSYSADVADAWVGSIPNHEIREQLCINLLQQLPYAPQLAGRWVESDENNIRTTGYWLMARLFIIRKDAGLTGTNAPYVFADAVSGDLFLRNAALLALKHTGRQSEKQAVEILDKMSRYADSVNPVEQEAYNSLKFEFDFFFGN